ncbi:hypothetical protein H0H81_001522 [Sphagnurus paluster]|uniref:Homeobox domain-containing protein n=1 Tax=Sphagnurus paluster TaxID=117069 RepID=A0A9P7FNZ2_9AGAR|nr:hypothetical protein H0H81_001522 [Sphagnurus paluster]
MQNSVSPLQRLLANVSRHRQCFPSKQTPKAHPTPTPTPTSPATLRPLSLPIPDGLSPSLLADTGCSAHVSELLSEAFVRTAHTLHTAHEKAYQELAPRLSSGRGLSDQLRDAVTALENSYHDQLRAAEEHVIEQVRQSSQPSSSQPTPKRVFNQFNQSYVQEFVPLLEKYFEYNAYPSAADRAVLARKSMMSQRQIEVWFQNHRNRAKKEGKEIKRLTLDPLPLELSLKSLEKKMPFFVIPEKERMDGPVAAVSALAVEAQEDDGWAPKNFSSHIVDAPCAIISTTPPHAFPTAYPPSCDYDPFPVKTGKYTFPHPVWMRKPATPRPPQKVPINMDDLIDDFQAKLHFRTPASLNPKQKSARPLWYAATRVHVSPAPHPALYFYHTLTYHPRIFNPFSCIPITKPLFATYHPCLGQSTQLRQNLHAQEDRATAKTHTNRYQFITSRCEPSKVGCLVTFSLPFLQLAHIVA